jgi:hypothetical protein
MFTIRLIDVIASFTPGIYILSPIFIDVVGKKNNCLNNKIKTLLSTNKGIPPTMVQTLYSIENTKEGIYRRPLMGYIIKEEKL